MYTYIYIYIIFKGGGEKEGRPCIFWNKKFRRRAGESERRRGKGRDRGREMKRKCMHVYMHVHVRARARARRGLLARLARPKKRI